MSIQLIRYKHIYSGNNPLKYIDPDGEDITIFYRPAHGGSNANFGHIFIGALNQDSGKVGFLEYYPNGRRTAWAEDPVLSILQHAGSRRSNRQTEERRYTGLQSTLKQLHDSL